MNKESKLDKIRYYYKVMRQYHLHTYKYWKICIEKGIPIEGDIK